MEQNHGEIEDVEMEEKNLRREEDEKEVISLRLLKLSNYQQVSFFSFFFFFFFNLSFPKMSRVFNLLRHHSDAIHFYLNEFIFPKYTRHQIVKLSESGQALGSSLLFPKPRIGFSGKNKNKANQNQNPHKLIDYFFRNAK